MQILAIVSLDLMYASAAVMQKSGCSPHQQQLMKKKSARLKQK